VEGHIVRAALADRGGPGADEVQRSPRHADRILEHLFGEQHQQPFSADERRRAPQLVGIQTAPGVGEVPHREAGRGVAQGADVEVVADPLVLERDGFFERAARLETQPPLVLVMRPCTVDGVAEDDDQPRVGERLGDPAHGERIKDVRRAGFSADRPLAAAHRRKHPPVPFEPVVEVQVEEVHLLRERATHVGVAQHLLEQEGRPSLLHTGDDEVRQPARAAQLAPGARDAGDGAIARLDEVPAVRRLRHRNSTERRARSTFKPAPCPLRFPPNTPRPPESGLEASFLKFTLDMKPQHYSHALRGPIQHT